MKTFMVLLSGKRRHLMMEDLIRKHVDYLRQLKKEGHLSFCGPWADGTALMILSCDSLEHAHELLQADPYSDVEYDTDKK